MDLKNIDTSNMLKEIESLPFQIEESLDIMNDYKFKIKNFEKINNVVIVGMGGVRNWWRYS